MDGYGSITLRGQAISMRWAFCPSLLAGITEEKIHSPAVSPLKGNAEQDGADY